MTKPVTVLIHSRNRPLYLWACLDSLYRHTRYQHRFMLFDSASDDPLVEKIIRGFERRGMFERVIRAERNDPGALAELAFRELDNWAPYVAYVESDVVIEGAQPCWLEQMIALMESNPRLAMLGSAIDLQDFVDPESVENLRNGEDDVHWRARIKADSPERRQNVEDAQGQPLFSPHNPAGRFLMLRSAALKEVGLADDHVLDAKLRAAGYETATAVGVRHRHLSLIQLFDYPDYDIDARNRYMEGLNTPS